MRRRLFAVLSIAALVCVSDGAGAAGPMLSVPLLDVQIAGAMNANRDPRAIYTIVDLAFLKTIATALKEYAVDHQNAYPKTLDALTPKYLKMVPVVPGREVAPVFRTRNRRPLCDDRAGYAAFAVG